MEKIIVFIKQVPDTMEVRIDPETNRIIREGVPSIINPYDRYAMEAALRLKESFGSRAVVACMGPPQAEAALREAMSLGFDQAILLSSRDFAGSDTLATSYTLAALVRKLAPVDVVVCGREAMDGSTGQVGPEMAEHLGWPFLGFVSKVEELKEGRLRVNRMMEDHYEEIEGPLPLVMTVVKEIAEPRLPSLRGLLQAKKAQIQVWGREELEMEPARTGSAGSPTWVKRVWTPEHHTQGMKLTGEPEELVDRLYKELKGQNLL
ncbi:MAG TPA: electron transfer flavoprotein subunit beta/FixA family protein [bacterium]|uniref:Acryloyl-CoA reductase electron transfer subunit gamma n=1 Tax=candidate division TA06 bacterium ADurb.Bin417 TaxID=1852828 RepID=A0A1V5MG04_UNCT6|nr:MAG: Acryloyl-CoA reductase electron transfer subunit gamma [candidate division TA06 bacterium ADurb.Bin417]HNQ35316.1 electron transfer flavoprotein subunit beta/FixA family protein [bacterium]HNS49461.1 electron transfer flavoprotein subunit beta/FixA family protein [bacterium]